MKLDPYLSLYTKINFREIKDLIVRPENMKLLKENTGKTPESSDAGENFLDETPKA